MSTVVTQANEQLREAILAALGEAVAAGELPGEPIPAFVIEIPADRGHGDLAANVAAVDAAFSSYRLDTEGYIRTGIVYYDGPAPVYGVAVGQNLTTTEIDGRQVVEQNNFRAVFTAQKLSFWQDSTEIAYVSNNRLYITSITVLDSISIGSWRMESGSGLTFKWIGG